MAKKMESFFIRGNLLHTTATGYQDIEIDLGAYVNARDGSVIRIHSIECAIQDNTNYEKGPVASAAAADLNVRWQLCTEQVADLVLLGDDKSVVASGSYFTAKDAGDAVIFRDNVIDVGPQTWVNGYLCASPALYLGADMDDTTSNGYNVSLVIEASVEKITKENAMALSLSQS